MRVFTVLLTDKTEMIAIKRTKSLQDGCGGSTSSVIRSYYWMTKILKDKHTSSHYSMTSLSYNKLEITYTNFSKFESIFTLQGIYSFQYKFIILHFFVQFTVNLFVNTYPILYTQNIFMEK